MVAAGTVAVSSALYINREKILELYRKKCVKFSTRACVLVGKLALLKMRKHCVDKAERKQSVITRVLIHDSSIDFDAGSANLRWL